MVDLVPGGLVSEVVYLVPPCRQYISSNIWTLVSVAADLVRTM